MWSYLSSSIWVRMLLVGICSFLVLVCREWRWISWIRIHLFHHGLPFPIWYIFSVVLSKSMCISAFGPSSNPSNSFVILLIHSAFLLCSLGCHILVQNCSVSLTSGGCYVSVSSSPPHLSVEFPFVVLECPFFVCIVLPFVDIFLIFLLSLVLSGLLTQVVLLFFLVLPFSFCPYTFLHLSFVLSFWPVSVDSFLSTFLVEFPILVLIFFLVLFEGILIFSQNNFAPA